MAANRLRKRSSLVPVYYFHVRGGASDSEGEEGLEYPNDDAAKDAVIAGARSLIAADVLDGILNLSSRIDVMNEHGAMLFSVPFSAAVKRI